MFQLTHQRFKIIKKKLLEISSANCNRKFQVQLANKDFLQELKNIVGPKLQPPLSIQEKVLYLIQVFEKILLVAETIYFI